MTLRRARRHADLPLADRVFARAVMLGATTERPTEAAVEDLCRLAAGDREALTRALNRIDHPSGRVGHTGVIASVLLRAALAYEDAPVDEELQQAGGQ